MAAPYALEPVLDKCGLPTVLTEQSLDVQLARWGRGGSLGLAALYAVLAAQRSA